MPEQRDMVSGATNSLVEVLDRILDKGIVIDAWVSVSVIGIELITIEARVIVASIETYVKYAAVLGYVGPIAGGLRQPTERKTLGEGVRDLTRGINEGLQQLPLVGQAENKLESVAQAGQQRQTTASQKQKKNGRKSKSKRGRKK